MKKWKPYKVKDGEWRPAAAYLGCCDCGLVHKTIYRWTIKNNKLIKLEVQATRAYGFTKSARKHRKYPFKESG